MKKSFPLFYKLLLSFIVCGIIPLVIISFLIYGLSVKFIDDMLYEQTYINLKSMHHELNMILKQYEDVVRSLQENEKIIQAVSDVDAQVNENEVYEEVFSALKDQSGKPPVYILNTSGSIVYSTHPLPHIYGVGIKNDWGIFREMLQTPHMTTIYPQKIDYPEGWSTLLSLGRNIYDEDGNHIGYILIDVKRDLMINIFRPHINGVPIHMVLLDDRLYTILDIQSSKMEGRFQNSRYLNNEKIIETKGLIQELEKDDYLNVTFYDEITDITTVAHVHYNIFQKLLEVMKTLLIVGCFISFLICCMISIVLAEHLSSPMKQLINLMGQVEKGDFSVCSDFNRNDEIGAVGTYFNQMVKQLKVYLDKIIEDQNKIRSTEIKMLQAQINPHFLYNTLDVIKWSAKLNHSEEVTTIVTNLAKILRNSIDCEDEFATVSQSVDFIKSYIAIQKIKYNNSFDVVINIEQSILEHRILRLILQPFVENAIIHGLTNLYYPGLITITGEQQDDFIMFQVIDNGVGMSEEQIKNLYTKKNEQHIGIYNVDKRIKLYYGNQYGVNIESTKNQGTKVLIKIPYLIGGSIQYDQSSHS